MLAGTKTTSPGPKAASINNLDKYSELEYVPLRCDLALHWQQSWLPCCHNWTNGLDDLWRRRRPWRCPVAVSQKSIAAPVCPGRRSRPRCGNCAGEGRCRPAVFVERVAGENASSKGTRSSR